VKEGKESEREREREREEKRMWSAREGFIYESLCKIESPPVYCRIESTLRVTNGSLTFKSMATFNMFLLKTSIFF
jgi:hypothetical protein